MSKILLLLDRKCQPSTTFWRKGFRPCGSNSFLKVISNYHLRIRCRKRSKKKKPGSAHGCPRQAHVLQFSNCTRQITTTSFSETWDNHTEEKAQISSQKFSPHTVHATTKDYSRDQRLESIKVSIHTKKKMWPKSPRRTKNNSGHCDLAKRQLELKLVQNSIEK